VSQGFDPEDIKEYSALGLGWSLVGSLVVCILGGVFLDQLLDTTPVLTLIGIVLGLVSAGYLLYELTLINRKDRDAGPVARRLGSRTRQTRPPGGNGPDGRVQ
jgi:F0F1-type ATP synthase assembly protein I